VGPDNKIPRPAAFDLIPLFASSASFANGKVIKDGTSQKTCHQSNYTFLLSGERQ
jgi:hypothetical protein